MRFEPGRLWAAPALLLVLGPTAAGLAGTVLPAFGWLPAIGREDLSLDPWRELRATPGLGRAVLLSLASGLGSKDLGYPCTLPRADGTLLTVYYARDGEGVTFVRARIWRLG